MSHRRSALSFADAANLPIKWECTRLGARMGCAREAGSVRQQANGVHNANIEQGIRVSERLGARGGEF
jgi:hypothetical protein